MKITELTVEEAQLNESSLTQSYTEAFWRHGKQMLKGAVVLGTGLLAYTTWRNLGTQTQPGLSVDNSLSTKDNSLDNSLPITVVQELKDTLDITPHVSNNKRRTTVNQCIPTWQEFNSQAEIAGAAFSNGDYVMAWTGNDGYIYAQRYAADGSLIGNELSVSDNMVELNKGPVITVLNNNNFVVAWATTSLSGFSAYRVYARTYDSLGNQVTPAFQIAPGGYPASDNAAISALSDGTFAIVLSLIYPTTAQPYTYIYSPNGILQYTYGMSGGIAGRTYPEVAGLTNGNAQVTLLNPNIVSYSCSSAGCLASPFFVSGNISYPVIAGLANTNFVIAWSYEQSTYAQIASPKVAFDSIFQVNTSPGGKSHPGVMSFPSNGNFIIAWQNRNDVYMQRYSLSSTNSSIRLGPELLLFSTPSANTGVSPYTPMFALPNGDFFVMWQNWAQRIYNNLTIANTCDQSYTENIPKQLGLSVSALSYAFNQTTISVQLLNAIAGQLKSLLTTSGTATASYNATSGIWLETGANVADLNALLSTLQFIPALNYNANASISVNAQDDLGNAFQSEFTLQGIPVDYPPTWINNQIIINQNQKLILSRNNIQLYDTDKVDSAITISVISAQNGQFELTSQPGIAITTFTQAYVDAGSVAFVHNGLALAPTYALVATDGTFTTPVSIGNINFDLAPEIIINVLTIKSRGETVTLARSQLLAQDSDNLPNQLIFTVSDVQHGHFELATDPGKAVTTFNQLYIDSGLVKFKHDGSGKSPAYTLTVNDGRITSTPSEAIIAFNVPANENLAQKIGIPLATTAVGTVVGFAAWRYRNKKDAERRRNESLIANIIRDDLSLSGVHDFKSVNGVQFVQAIDTVLRALESNHQIHVAGMTQPDQEAFAHKLATCLKPYTSTTVPQNIMQGSNMVTSAYLSAYYQKVKPFIKSDGCWLDTDEVKKSSAIIAAQVKNQPNSATINSGYKQIEMQALNI